MSLMGLTGAHGTGKSTIIQGVGEFGVQTIQSSLSRTAQATLGWDSPARAGDSEENMWQFQEAILGAMYDRDMSILGDNTLTLVDRTPADVWGYVSLWSHRLGGADPAHLKDFKNRCRVMASRYTAHIIVPIHDDVPFVEEQGRADIDSRDFHEKEICQFILTGGLTHTVLLQTGIDERVTKVAVMMNTLQSNLRMFQHHDKQNKTNYSQIRPVS